VAAAPGFRRRLLHWLSALLLLGLMASAGHLMLQREPTYLPIRVVTVDGELARLSPERLQRTVIEHLNGGIVTQDLAALKDAVEALAWVRSASLRRFWPDRLELTVVEHRPLARWGEDGLVSLEGVVFRPPEPEIPKALPKLMSDDVRAPQLARRYEAWKPRFTEQGLDVSHIAVDARGAWTLGTNAGFDLALGTTHVEQRVNRFLSAWPSLAGAGRLTSVDMRYSNGMAVVWDAESLDESSRVDAADVAPMIESRGRLSGSDGDHDWSLSRFPAHRSGPFSQPSAHGPRSSRS
jgi:cell division protein FtsQ